MVFEQWLVRGLYIAEESGEFYYFNEHMLKDNIVIAKTRDSLLNMQLLRIYFVDYKDVGMLDISSIDVLDDLQVYRLIKDIYELYNELSKTSFLQVMYEMAVSICTTNSMLTLEDEQRLRENTEAVIDNIRYKSLLH